eukprot:m.13178 g.13178  ORF g.13178 m.13178 type:complete len:226 (+) comp4484_c0_seq1:495-1172(+)
MDDDQREPLLAINHQDQTIVDAASPPSPGPTLQHHASGSASNAPAFTPTVTASASNPSVPTHDAAGFVPDLSARQRTNLQRLRTFFASYSRGGVPFKVRDTLVTVLDDLLQNSHVNHEHPCDLPPQATLQREADLIFQQRYRQDACAYWLAFAVIICVLFVSCATFACGVVLAFDGKGADVLSVVFGFASMLGTVTSGATYSMWKKRSGDTKPPETTEEDDPFWG